MAFKDVSWMAQANCRGMAPKKGEPDIFFPDRGESAQPARAICADCPVRTQCLEYGLWDSDGVFGGSTEPERRVLRKERGGRFAQRDRHGRRGTYVRGCRCERCVEANRAYGRVYDRRRIA